ncbi:MAG TPA: hypothetical protein VIY48_21915 [Candidatus Paceibacterota bacterium]
MRPENKPATPQEYDEVYGSGAYDKQVAATGQTIFYIPAAARAPKVSEEFALYIRPRRTELKRTPKAMTKQIIESEFPDASPEEIEYLKWLIGQDATKPDEIDSPDLNLFYGALHTAGATNAALARHNHKSPQAMHQRLNRVYSRIGPVKQASNAWSFEQIEVAYKIFLDMLETNPLLRHNWTHIELGAELWIRSLREMNEELSIHEPAVASSAPVETEEEIIIEGRNDASPQSMEEAMRQMREKLSNG